MAGRFEEEAGRLDEWGRGRDVESTQQPRTGHLETFDDDAVEHARVHVLTAPYPGKDALLIALHL